LLKNSEFGFVRVELAFRPASKPFVVSLSRLLADASNGRTLLFQRLVKLLTRALGSQLLRYSSREAVEAH